MAGETLQGSNALLHNYPVRYFIGYLSDTLSGTRSDTLSGGSKAPPFPTIGKMLRVPNVRPTSRSLLRGQLRGTDEEERVIFRRWRNRSPALERRWPARGCMSMVATSDKLTTIRETICLRALHGLTWRPGKRGNLLPQPQPLQGLALVSWARPSIAWEA